MSYLIDTNVAVMLAFEPWRLSQKTVDLLADPRAEVWFSAAVRWEIAIKAALGKYPVDAARLNDALVQGGCTPLPIEARHGIEAGGLPLHHRDPFDRIMIAQAGLQGLTLVTTDRAFDRYAVDLLLV